MAITPPNCLRSAALALLSALALASVPAAAQLRTVDPDAMIDGDLAGRGASAPTVPAEVPGSAADAISGQWLDISKEPAAGNGTPVEAGVSSWSADDIGATPAQPVAPAADTSTTYREDDLIGAAEGLFGKGAYGLASIIQDLLKKQGEPNGYIVGREGGGAVAFGLRYGSGTLHHRIEGTRPVYWTGPSIGFDLGANAGKAFVLVYNLHDSQDLFKRYGAGEGQAYMVGGFHVSYLRRGDVVLIPVRMGAGLRLGANVGYMKFSERQNWLPF